MSVDAPNYTQVPNALLDEWMGVMGEAELKVALAVCRKTFGWHKRADRLSLSQLEQLTGLTRQGVVNGINAAMERGVIGREASGNSYSYFVLVNEIDQQVVNEIDQGSQRNRLEIVNEIDPQKKERNYTKENVVAADAAAPERAEQQLPTTRRTVKAKQPPHKARKEAYREVVTGRGLQTNFRRAGPVLDELEEIEATPGEVQAAVARALDSLGWQRGAYYFEKVPDAVRSYRATLAAQHDTATVGGMRVWQPERRAS